MIKKAVSLFLSFALVFSVAAFSANAQENNMIFVSTNGNDSASGTVDSPLASLSAAKEKAKSLDGSVTVCFREGSYSIDRTVIFDGTDKQGVTYKAYDGEKVVFTSGTPFSGFEECTVNGIRAFRKSVGEAAKFNILFNEETTLSRTRYPESGYLYVGATADSDVHPDCDPADAYFAGFLGMYAGENDDFRNFKNINDVTIKLLHFWKDETLRIASYDGATRHIAFNKPSSMTIKKGDRYFLENVFEMLKNPGQWYLDKSEGMLYVIPREEDNPNDYTVWGSTNETMIEINGVDGISFENIIFRANGFNYDDEREFTQAAYDAKSCISYQNARDFHIKSCEFRDIAACSVFIGNAAQNASIENCIFDNIGAQAVYVRGENLDISNPAVTKNIAIKNNLISDFGRVYYNAVAILVIHANSVDIMNNEIHDGFYSAISVGWIWGYDYSVCYNNRICNNLIYNIGQGWLSDMGGIYTLGNQPNTVISGNVIHNVSADPEEGGYGGWGIYLDEGSSYILVEKNLVYSCGSDSYHLHYGSYNTVRNNIFALSAEAQMRIVTAPQKCAPADGGKKTADVYNNIILTDKKARALSCVRNVDALAESNNIYWDLSAGDEIYIGKDNTANRSMSIETAIRKDFIHSPIIADPMFRDARNFDFALSPDSPSIGAGFEPWDYSLAGTISGSTIGISAEGGTTEYNLNSANVEMKPASEPLGFFVKIINSIYFLFKNLFSSIR